MEALDQPQQSVTQTRKDKTTENSSLKNRITLLREQKSPENSGTLSDTSLRSIGGDFFL